MLEHPRLVAKSNEVASRHGSKLLDRLGHGIEHGQFNGVVARFFGIQLGSVAREPFDDVVGGVTPDEGGHALGPVGGQVVPHDDQRAPDARSEVAQGSDDFGRLNRLEKMPGIQPRRRPVQRRGHGDEARDLAPFREPAEDGRVADRSPRRGDAGPKRETCLVQKGNDAPALTSPFFIRGQSRASHALISASSRSLARVGGRCGVQPWARRTRPNERQW